MVFKVSADQDKNEKTLYVPYWALSFEELTALALGRLSDSQAPAVMDAIVQHKKESLAAQSREGID
jgi:hypothetical protein